MADLPYTINTGSIPKLLDHIQSAGMPDKLSQAYLKKLGFTSSNDRYLVALFRDIGFASADGTPTEVWTAYRDSARGPGVLAQALRAAYSDLFHTYPDAFRKDDEAIVNWMKTAAPRASETTIGRALASFKALCLRADFEAAPPGVMSAATAAAAAASDPTPGAGMAAALAATAVATRNAAPTIAINVELVLPQTADPDVYDNLFAAMRKHLFGP